MTKLSLTAMALAAAGVLAFTVPKAIAEEGGGDKPKKEEPRREGDGAKKEGDKPAAPEVKSGTVRGVVVSVKENRLQLKDKEGHTESYMPKWIGGMPADGGGLDKEMVAKLQTLKEGMWVEITWMWEERRRVTSIKVLEEGKGGDRKDGEHKDGEKKDGEHKDGDRK